MSGEVILAVSIPIVALVILVGIISVVMRRCHRKRMDKLLGEISLRKSLLAMSNRFPKVIFIFFSLFVGGKTTIGFLIKYLNFIIISCVLNACFV
jgi:hypothetical protein